MRRGSSSSPESITRRSHPPARRACSKELALPALWKERSRTTANDHCDRHRSTKIRLPELPGDMVFYTQITMEPAEATEYLAAIKKGADQRRAGPRGSRHPKRFEGGVQDLQFVRATVWSRKFSHFGSTASTGWDPSFGVPTDTKATFDATVTLAQKQGLLLLSSFCLRRSPARWIKARTETRRSSAVYVSRCAG
jgi:hypothetical protein